MAFGLISMTSTPIEPEQSFASVVSPNLSPGIVSEQSTWTSLSPKLTVAISRSCRAVHEAAPFSPSWLRAKASTDRGQVLQHRNDLNFLPSPFSRKLSANPHF